MTDIDWDDIEALDNLDESEDAPAEPELVYGSAGEFFTIKLAGLYRREVSGTVTGRRWCPQWWTHSEALSRIESLWRAWEHLRLDGATGMSVWWRDHADHHMNALLSPDGTFAHCSVKNGHHDESSAIAPLPQHDPPPELFPDARTA
ncbi:DUF4913 domain-containing protein [Rhodococcus rhodnii]|uniref:DUF4913 domain-containing protein n=1 Tax=Rhodococcus rhodnii TaxID=38312 RepID=UPI0009333E38|nr:DUF4913 domain-containing protein [Rhodococcus rhodnii]